MAVGVTVTVAVTGRVAIFTATNAGVLPSPEAARPMEASELVHANVAPGVVLVNADAGMFPPLQSTTFAGTVTLGPGLTVMV